MSIDPVLILVATMTGTAELCAEEVVTALAKSGIRSKSRLMDGLDTSALLGARRILFISSTYGQGDIPDNGQKLFSSLQEGPKLDFEFAVFGLGDMTFSATFCDAGFKWDQLLELKAGRRLAPLRCHDACCGELAEDVASAWAHCLVSKLQVDA